MTKASQQDLIRALRAHGVDLPPMTRSVRILGESPHELVTIEVEAFVGREQLEQVVRGLTKGTA